MAGREVPTAHQRLPLADVRECASGDRGRGDQGCNTVGASTAAAPPLPPPRPQGDGRTRRGRPQGPAHCCPLLHPASASHRGPGWSLGRLLLSPPGLPWVALGRWALPAPPLVMPLGHPRVSPKMSLGGLREPEGVGAPWRLSWGRCPWWASSCSWPSADSRASGGRAVCPGMHEAPVGTEPGWGLLRPGLEVFAGLGCTLDPGPVVAGRLSAKSRTERFPLGVGRERDGLGLKQGEGRGGRAAPLTLPCLPQPYLTPDPGAGSGQRGSPRVHTCQAAASAPFPHIGQRPTPVSVSGTFQRTLSPPVPARSCLSEGGMGPSLLDRGPGVGGVCEHRVSLCRVSFPAFPWPGGGLEGGE